MIIAIYDMNHWPSFFIIIINIRFPVIKLSDLIFPACFKRGKGG